MNNFKFSSKVLASFILMGILLLTGTIEKSMNLNDLAVEAANLDGIILQNGKKFYYKNGMLQKGQHKVNGNWYLFDRKTGEMKYGQQKDINGQWYLFDRKNGVMRKGQVYDAGNWYLFDRASGAMRKGQVYDAGNWYLFDRASGVMRKGQVKDAGSWYFFDRASGIMKKGVVQDQGNSYLFDRNSGIRKYNLTTGKFFTNIYSIKSPGDLLVIANKNNALASSYVPSKLRNVNVTRKSSTSTRMVDGAASALESLFAGAKKSGIQLGAFSGYRSYKDQQAAYGKYKDDSISARPGHSEHQTGLAQDVVSAAKVNGDGSNVLVQSYGTTKEGKWLAANAHKYGFIIRYPKGKEKITGYSYEPWHIRYVGKDVAAKLYAQNWTLEEAYINGYLK